MWRKALQICKIISSFTLIGFCSLSIFPQSIDFPQFPSTHVITSPEMPQISSPSLGSGFYIPGTQNQISKTQKESSPQKISQTESTTTQNQALKSKTLQNLSSDQIKELLDSGLFTELYDLTGENSSTINLTRVINNLNELNETIKNSQTESKAESKTEQNFSPKILRFTVNGKNLLPSCKNVCFSRPETDGTFLLTADRIFQTSTENCNETFYILFKKNQSSSSNLTYNVEQKIIQNTKNESSDLLNFSELKNLVATKTGNLVHLSENSENFNLDLLIDLGIA